MLPAFAFVLRFRALPGCEKLTGQLQRKKQNRNGRQDHAAWPGQQNRNTRNGWSCELPEIFAKRGEKTKKAEWKIQREKKDFGSPLDIHRLIA
jgi:hypothetical protein